MLCVNLCCNDHKFAHTGGQGYDHLFFSKKIYWKHWGGGAMRVYLDLVLLLNFSVDFLLIVGTNRLAGYPYSFRRAIMASCLGAVYAALCMLHGF